MHTLKYDNKIWNEKFMEEFPGTCSKCNSNEKKNGDITVVISPVFI